MTNADCIRKMNDEELYEFLLKWEHGNIDYSITFCDICERSGNTLGFNCDKCIKDWLERDTTDYEGLMYWHCNVTPEFKEHRKKRGRL